MPRLAEVESRLASIRDLYEIIAAMRSLAAARMRQAQGTLSAIRSYAATVSDAIGQSMALLPSSTSRATATISASQRALLVFCTEHGFVGAINDALLDRCAAMLAAGEALYVVGSRGALAADERRMAVTWHAPMASHPSGVVETARRIAGELYRRVDQGQLAQVRVLYCRGETAAVTIEHEKLLPPDLARFQLRLAPAIPLHHIPTPILLERLAAEYVMAELTRMAMESLAAENAARMRAMASARENVDRKLEQLVRDEHRLRQDAVTMDLLDLVTGSEALRNE